MNSSGILTVKEAFNVYREGGNITNWLKKIWQSYLPQKLSVFAWKLYCNCLPTEDQAVRRGTEVYGGCCIYYNELILEDQDHILMQCDYAAMV